MWRLKPQLKQLLPSSESMRAGCTTDLPPKMLILVRRVHRGGEWFPVFSRFPFCRRMPSPRPCAWCHWPQPRPAAQELLQALPNALCITPWPQFHPQRTHSQYRRSQGACGESPRKRYRLGRIEASQCQFRFASIEVKHSAVDLILSPSPTLGADPGVAALTASVVLRGSDLVKGPEGHLAV
jgi:hypothetical protein